MPDEKRPDEWDHTYLQLSSGHFENELGHGADGETSRAGGVDLVPDGVTVHLDTQNTSLKAFSRMVRAHVGW